MDRLHSLLVCCGEKKAGGPIGTNLLGILVLLSCGVCETRNVQKGNSFGLFGTRALRAFWILDLRYQRPQLRALLADSLQFREGMGQAVNTP